jgi:integrase
MTRQRHTGSLRLRRNVWWARYYHNGTRVEVSTGEIERPKALAVLRAKLKDADTARFVAPAVDRVRFADLVTLLQQDRARKRLRSRIAQHLAPLTEAFAKVPARHLTTQMVDHYVERRLAAKYEPATINRELAALRRMFRLAVRKGVLPSMPVIELLPEDNVRGGFLDPPDLARFLEVLRTHDPVATDATEFAYRTLLRRGNVLGAAWAWFSLDVVRGHVVGGGMRIPGSATKNKKALTLPLTGDLVALLDRRWQVRVETCPYLFHRDGVPLVRFDAAWQQAAHAIGRRGLLFHDLRRSGARTLRRAGVSEDVIMKLGGWKTRSMFTRYAIVDERDLADAQAELDAALALPGPPRVVPLPRPRRR